VASDPNGYTPIGQAKADERARDAAGDDSRDDDMPGLDDCPVTVLGNSPRHLYFFNPQGQFVQYGARELEQWGALRKLFGLQWRWCRKHFPQRDENNRVTGFNARSVFGFLVDKSEEAGLFDARLPRRGVGVWREGGEVLVHLGRRVLDLRTGAERAAGFMAHRALWPAEPSGAVPAPVFDAAGGEDVAEVESLVGRWSWSGETEADRAAQAAAFVGLWAVGLLGGAAPWRPHGLVVGQPGWGKTSLFQFYRAISPLAEEFNDFSEAGLRGVFNGRSAPMVLDEAEADEQAANRMDAVIGMIRKMSAKDGLKAVRFGVDGPLTYSLNSTAMLGAVLPPQLAPADMGRFTRLDLAMPAKNGRPLPDEDEIADWQARAPALWGRALAGIDRFTANLQAFIAELRKRGCSRRYADQLGAVLAARAMMLVDRPLNARQVAEHALMMRRFIRTEVDEAAESGPQQCLQHLLGCSTDAQVSNTRQTVGRLVVKARTDAEAEFARAALLDHGLWFGRYPLRGESRGDFLYVANTHPALRRFFHNLRWAGGRWREDLRHLEGALEPKDPIRMASLGKRRAVLIPAALLPRGSAIEDGDDEDGTNGTENGTEFSD